MENVEPPSLYTAAAVAGLGAATSIMQNAARLDHFGRVLSDRLFLFFLPLPRESPPLLT
jgi:hypothetical protein